MNIIEIPQIPEIPQGQRDQNLAYYQRAIPQIKKLAAQ